MWVKFGQVPEAFHLARWRYNGNIIIVMENMGPNSGVSVSYWMGLAEVNPYSLGSVGEYQKEEGYQPLPDYLQPIYYLEDAEIVEA